MPKVSHVARDVLPGLGHHGVMADDDLDELFRAKPEEFTALRTELAAAAKKRGDAFIIDAGLQPVD